ncbi:CRE_HP_G0120090.mRNA.1.CDS.1 [Saccharomyces cerevisiae]|nr:CRE_HP_G0000610.mRNA.1.CDS.1 [Saccharomyces cerevisiae]CAI4965899.1 CRE_HP_G0002090.mRNA.1.CDS.1 [Saccharomyces cerevisiae]CAI5078934.1 CRE_HP_G0120090.mRNA.1.CDS.1 [Saccharomyces cerevisiae]CAI6445204.1 CRE_HP_G0000610.mRNA.1.CDS.1 [Saccharomyces cerevisiae]CAI6711891.1 CRE_HP_G0002090.mRNA.1.CDS.1 [Saccharomyces cerevisiae]
MTFFLKRKISFFFVRHCTNFFISAYTLKQISHSCCLLMVVLGHRMPWDSVIRCNNTGTTHSALSSRTELLLPIGGVINNWKRRAWNGFSIQWIWRYSFVY